MTSVQGSFEHSRRSARQAGRHSSPTVRFKPHIQYKYKSNYYYYYVTTFTDSSYYYLLSTTSVCCDHVLSSMYYQCWYDYCTNHIYHSLLQSIVHTSILVAIVRAQLVASQLVSWYAWCMYASNSASHVTCPSLPPLLVALSCFGRPASCHAMHPGLGSLALQLERPCHLLFTLTFFLHAHHAPARQANSKVKSYMFKSSATFT